MNFTNMKYWLSKGFKKSECVSFLNNIIYNDNIYSFIRWADQDYKLNFSNVFVNKKMNNIFIDYKINNTIDQNINVYMKSNNRRIFMDIIHRGNYLKLIDENNDSINTYIISHNINNTSFFSHESIIKTGNKRTRDYYSKILIDDFTGNVLSYYNSKDACINNNYSSNNKVFIK